MIFWDADDLFEHNALEVMYAQAEQETPIYVSVRLASMIMRKKNISLLMHI